MILAFCGLAGITLPHWLGWLLLLATVVFASYNVWAAERQALVAVTLAKTESEKARQREESLVTYSRTVNAGQYPLYALMLARAYDLPSNDDLLAFIDEVVAMGHQHPFRSDYWRPDRLTASGYLEYLRDARLKGCEFRTHDEIVLLGRIGINQTWDEFFGDKSK